jgi:Type II secretion system (T2SS), protein E, N-terminal domain
MLRNAGKRLRRWGAACLNSWKRFAPACGYHACVHARSPWRRIRRRSRGVLVAGTRYCRTECLEQALAQVLERSHSISPRSALASHRIPLGLLLLSRQQLTSGQLRSALEAQRTAGRGKIGAWLQQLGFNTEEQVTAALARQWSCPVLRTAPGTTLANRFPQIPVLLLEFFQMIPVESVEATKTLLIAFSERIDYTVLYAIEQMLGYRTEPCVVPASILQKSLQALARNRTSSDVVLEHVKDTRECAQIVCNYSEKVGATEIRLARCGAYLWVRLESLRHGVVNLVLCIPANRHFSNLGQSGSPALAS